jgi:GH18 family chitinase
MVIGRHWLKSVAIAAMCLAQGTFAAGNFKVIGYFPSWVDDLSMVQFDKLTHINYAFTIPSADGSIDVDEDNPEGLRAIVAEAHNNGVQVGIAVGGYSNSSGFSQAVTSGKTNFINNLMKAVADYNLDGIDIDWEYPSGGEAGSFASFLSDLKARLGNKYLSIAVSSGEYNADGISDEVINAVDFVNIMAYDAGTPHSPSSIVQTAFNNWSGGSNSKLIMGLPFYARNGGEEITYKSIIASNASAADCNVDQESSQFGYDYNSKKTIAQKTQFALQNCGGVMVWELSSDATGSASLQSAIYEVAKNQMSKNYSLSITATHGNVTLNPNKTSFASGETVTLTASADAGYKFTNWSGDASGTTNPLTVTMDKSKSVSAIFSSTGTQDQIDMILSENASWGGVCDPENGSKIDTAFEVTNGQITAAWTVGKMPDTVTYPYAELLAFLPNGQPATGLTEVKVTYKSDKPLLIALPQAEFSESGANYCYSLAASSSWKTVVITKAQFKQPSWTEAADKGPLNLDKIVEIAFSPDVETSEAAASGTMEIKELVLYGVVEKVAVQPRISANHALSQRVSATPFAKGLRLTLTGFNPGAYTVSLFGVNGKQISQHEVIQTGHGDMVQLISGVASGVYCVKIANGSMAQSYKIGTMQSVR